MLDKETKNLLKTQYRCFIGKEKSDFRKKFPSRKYSPSINFAKYVNISLKKRKRRAVAERYVTYKDYLNDQMNRWKRLPESSKKEFESKILPYDQWSLQHHQSIAALGKTQQ